MLDDTANSAEKSVFPRDASRADRGKLARSIAWHGSKQTYLIARLLVDWGLRDDCCRAYAYFRWADDVIDLTAGSEKERIAFVNRQKSLIDRLYRGEQCEPLTAEEELLASLVRSDPSKTTGLFSFIHNFMNLLEFDAHRRGRLISQDELEWYSESLAKAVTDGIQYFIGHGHPYLKSKHQYKAVLAAHITHMLRDLLEDISGGYINIPREYLEEHAIDMHQLDSQSLREWVCERAALAHEYMEEGKQYLDQLEVLRCKLAGYWYCARYAGVLRTIERDDYVLRGEYKHGITTLLRIAWLGFALPVKHYAQRLIPSGQRRRKIQKSTGN